jgi:mycofactocin precursor
VEDDGASVAFSPGSGAIEPVVHAPAQSRGPVAQWGEGAHTLDEAEAASTGPTEEWDSEVGVDDEMIVEEISIDGLCGVY